MARRRSQSHERKERLSVDDTKAEGLLGELGAAEPVVSEPKPKPVQAFAPKPRPAVTAKDEEDNCVLIVMTADGARRIDPPLTTQTYMFWPGLPTKVCSQDREVLVGHKKLAESGVTFAPSDGSEEPSASVLHELRKVARRQVRINPGCGCSQ